MVSEWKATATKTQQDFAHLFGDRTWDSFSMPSHSDELRKKIAFALLGPPRDENDEEAFGYSTEEWEKVIEITTMSIDYCKMQDGNDRSGSVCVAFIFVCAFKSGSTSTVAPLIRVKNTSETDIQSSYFIDHCGRAYNTWKEYLEGNIFDGWWICVPFGAVYPRKEEVQVEFYDQSSRTQTAQDVSNATNKAFSKTKDVMSYFKATVPFDWAVSAIRGAVGAPGTAYGTGRDVCELIDHSNHDESIALLDFEEKAISASRIAIDNSLDNLKTKDDVTRLDVLQLTAFVFLFTHSELSFDAASNLIRQAQAEKLSEARQNLKPEDQHKFDVFLKGQQEMVTPSKVRQMHGKVREMHGTNEFIRELIRIGLPNLPKHLSNFSVVAGTLLNINKNLDIDTKAYLQMTPEQRDLILEQSRDLQNGKITHAQFDKNVGTISKEYRIKFEHQRQEARNKIQEAFQVEEVGDIVVAGERIFENLQHHELDRLHEVFTSENTGKKYNPICIEVGKVMGDILKCKNVAEFTAVMEYSIRKLDVIVKERRENNRNPKEKPVGVRSGDYYFGIVANEFLSDQGQQTAMAEEFNKLREACDAANNQGSPRFKHSYAAANHYHKHKNISIYPDTYFEIAREMTQGLHVGEPILSQEGNLLIYNFKSDDGAIAIRFDSLADGTSIIATLFLKEKKKEKSRLYSTVLKPPVG
jgi:hypothetical protein